MPRTWIEASSGLRETFPIDIRALRARDPKGLLTIGYFANTLHLNHGDEAAALVDAKRDLALFTAEGHRMKYFVPNGGNVLARPEAKSTDLDWCAQSPGPIDWVYNRYGLHTAGRYVDSNLRKVDPQQQPRDIVEFCRANKYPGQRVVVTLHPDQYGLAQHVPLRTASV